MVRLTATPATRRRAPPLNGAATSVAPIHPDAATPISRASAQEPADASGDLLYGARAIARFLFGADGKREQRRVFLLWSHYQHRPEKAGFLKLKGAVCLSKSRWRAFQG